jgi:hypothetical protein
MTIVQERRVASKAGIIAAAVFCVLLALVTAWASFASIFLGMKVAGCGDGCDYSAIEAGVTIEMFGSPIVGLLAIGLSIVYGVRRRRYSWVFPLAGFVVLIVLGIVADAVASIPNGLSLG